MKTATITNLIDRRQFLRLGATAGAATLIPGRIAAQTAVLPDRVVQGRAAAAAAPITTTRLYDNLYLLSNNVGGNMALQTGKDGLVLVDSNFSSVVPKLREAIAGVSHDSPDALINTHWHYDHTDGNEALHQAGFGIFAHQKTRERMSAAQPITFFHLVMPASPAAALPTITFDQSLHAWHNGDSLDLVHFDAAHTDTDIYVHFHHANVLHVGDIWFNNTYPFIDEATGGNINGMVKGAEQALAITDSGTKIIPGHGPLGSKPDLQKYRDMLAAVRDRVAALKSRGYSENEAIAKKPTADLDASWGKGFMTGDVFTGIVFRTL